MKITVSKEFDNAEEAIEFLQTLGIQIPQNESVEVVAALPQEAPEKRARKPRSDAGQPRGPYKPRDAAAPTQAITPAPESAAPAAAAPAALTVDDVKAAMTRLMKKEGVEGNLALLRQFGVEKVSLLSPAKYEEFIAAANAKAGVK